MKRANRFSCRTCSRSFQLHETSCRGDRHLAAGLGQDDPGRQAGRGKSSSTLPSVRIIRRSSPSFRRIIRKSKPPSCTATAPGSL
jgi:hypothetical protein